MILTTHYSYPTHPSLIDGLPHGPILVHLFFRALILSHLKRSLVGFKLRGFKLIVTGGSPKNPILELSEEFFFGWLEFFSPNFCLLVFNTIFCFSNINRFYFAGSCLEAEIPIKPYSKFGLKGVEFLYIVCTSWRWYAYIVRNAKRSCLGCLGWNEELCPYLWYGMMKTSQKIMECHMFFDSPRHTYLYHISYRYLFLSDTSDTAGDRWNIY